MVNVIPSFAQNWTIDITIAPEVAWSWALSLIIPTLLCGGFIVFVTLRELGAAARLRQILKAVFARRSARPARSRRSPALSLPGQSAASRLTRGTRSTRAPLRISGH